MQSPLWSELKQEPGRQAGYGATGSDGDCGIHQKASNAAVQMAHVLEPCSSYGVLDWDPFLECQKTITLNHLSLKTGFLLSISTDLKKN